MDMLSAAEELKATLPKTIVNKNEVSDDPAAPATVMVPATPPAETTPKAESDEVIEITHLVPLSVTTPKYYLDEVEVPEGAHRFSVALTPRGAVKVTVLEPTTPGADNDTRMGEMIYAESLAQVMEGFFYSVARAPKPGKYYTNVHPQPAGKPVSLAAADMKLVEAVMASPWADIESILKREDGFGSKLKRYVEAHSMIFMRSLQIVPYDDEARAMLGDSFKALGNANTRLFVELDANKGSK